MKFQLETDLAYFQYNEIQKAFHSDTSPLNPDYAEKYVSDWKTLGRIDRSISSRFINYINDKYESNRPDFETIKQELIYFLRRN